MNSNINFTHNYLSSILTDENKNNTSPILTKRLTQNKGIEIETSIKTTDSTEIGNMCYITTKRQISVSIAHDGYGCAWRKQPGFLIRLNNSTYTPEDVQTFIDHYRIDPLTGLASGNYSDEVADGEEVPSITGPIVGNLLSYPQFWKYNVFAIDNNVLSDNIYVRNEGMVLDETSGINNFMKAGKAWILPNVTYVFKVKIFETNGMEIYVDDTKIVDLGPFTPEYQTQSNGTYFGIGISDTKNYEWTINYIHIRNIADVIGMQLFRFKVNNNLFSLTDPFEIKYYGIGGDLNNQENGNCRVEARIYNVVTRSWQSIGTNTNVPEDAKEDTEISATLTPLSKYVDNAGYINIAAGGMNIGTDYPNDTIHELWTYYVQFNNEKTSSVHRGNCVDVYVHDPKNIKLGSAVATVQNNEILTQTITGIDNYIQEILEVREFISQVALTPSQYNITNKLPGKTFGTGANYRIALNGDFEGALIEVVYRYWSNGARVTYEFSSSDDRYPATDIVAKCMPPTVVNISKLRYSGGISLSEMKLKIKEYFNTLLESSFDKSDLVKVLYDNGATFVDLDIELNVREYDPIGNKLTTNVTGQSYEISDTNVSRFFTELSELAGVVKI